MSTERGWVAPRPGGSEVFELVEIEVPDPAVGEVTIEIRAAGMNPADYKHPRGAKPEQLPVRIGYEVAGVIRAIGPDTTIASGPVSIGDEVIAFRVSGGYATAITVPAKDVFAKPENLTFPEAANLLLAAATAADMIRVTGVHPGETVLVHGASGAVGVSLLQQFREIGGIRAIGTASASNADVVRQFGGEPVEYGSGLADRVRAMAPEGVSAAFDCVGTDEAVEVSLALVEDRDRIVTIAAQHRAADDGIRLVAGAIPESAAFRDSVRGRLIDLAAAGTLVVPVARTFPLTQAHEALDLLESGHPGGKLALIP
ncbi:NADP-dependent oxidoreductase [Curtobacterium ammoniigenes]|uniref:NADP-dependent oxidoreductase n=1 Tax=Curtobacterium ammoniigenes TaxID=395387 RepID=UPI00082FA239|nr:NADP-dependent oxidoreductase [Curtobacterium ammoniigenes]